MGSPTATFVGLADAGGISYEPTAPEKAAISNFWMRFPQQIAKGGGSSKQAKEQVEFAALSAFCQSLIASAEFRYLN